MRLVFLIILVVQFYGCMGQDMEGNWRGFLDVQSVKLPVEFRLEKDLNEVWTASVVGPAEAASALQFSSVKIKGDSIFLASSQNMIFFEGTQVSSTKIDGVFKRGDKSIPLVLHSNVKEVRRRPQTPSAPYPYDTVKVNFYNEFDQVKLAGTLTLPREQAQLMPAVVMVTGSGPQDRDETVDGHKPFKVIADYLTRRGIAVLCFDDRGVGKSKGDYPNSTIGDFSKDVIGALDYLREQKNVDPNNIGIIGHSEGGLIAMLVAGQRSAEVNFIGLLAPPAIAIDSLMVLQAYEVGRSVGLSQEELQHARLINRKNFAIVKSDLSDQDAYLQIMNNVSSVFPNPTQDQKNEFRMLVTPPYRYFMRIDPVPFIRQINVPVFAAYGTKDVQVPYAVNLESLTKNLPSGLEPTLKVYEGLNHFFQRAKTGSISEYAQLEETFSDEVMEDLVEWLHSM
ncbi:MAG: alpha/beta hydrolase family protein [Sphingobacterium sp.]|uniref:alpha/beta hydrolase family protein n=1 Tax=Sphingobacterium sp. JB170 TaxID=1434842 RepID=UPI00097EF80F|nr:alpha/beta fold hydrolase [Sphingobacterium sp. JB170]SJN50334.1 hypothetical protein FM107_20360 [Sphingobacterium sp. JB170]